jgi:hypothetical protein
MKKCSLLLIPLVLLPGCTDDRVKVTVENPLPFDRTAETL